jgi:hypothetical protein
MTKKTSAWDDEGNEVQSNWVKFNVPLEDKIFGTLISKRQMKSMIPGKEGELVWVYEMKADSGSFHETDDKKVVVPEPIVIEADQIFSVGGKVGIDTQMRNIKLGQKIGFKFIDEKPSKTKGFAPAKNIRVYAPKGDDNQPLMDTEWIDAQTTPDQKFDNYGK